MRAAVMLLIASTFLRAQPDSLSIELYELSVTAGVPFRAIVRIYDSVGSHIPGTYCFGNGAGAVPIAYQDVIGRPNQPGSVISDGGQAVIGLSPSPGGGLGQCFANGIDTLQVVLYYAPQSTDSLHQLIATIGGASPVSGSSRSFRLHPAPVATIVLTDLQGNPLPDSITLHAPTDAVSIQALGYDQFGNSLGPVSCVWSGRGGVDPPAPGPSTVLNYSTSTVPIEEHGIIYGSAAFNQNVRDTVAVHIYLGAQAVSPMAAAAVLQCGPTVSFDVTGRSLTKSPRFRAARQVISTRNNRDPPASTGVFIK